MEVCKKCMLEIKEDDQWISGDPITWTKIATASLQAGVDSTRENNKHEASQESNHKYHLNCYKQLESEDKKAVWWIILIWIVGALVIFLIIFFIIKSTN